MLTIQANKNGQTLYYTGGAGDSWVSADASKAFVFDSMEAVDRKLNLFNGRQPLTGLWFTVCLDLFNAYIAKHGLSASI